MSILTAINLLVFAGLIFLQIKLRKRELSLSRQVLSGLLIGLVFGGVLQLLYSNSNPEVLSGTLEWTNVVANIYVGLLRMIIMPLVLITMVAAVLRIQEVSSIGKIGSSVIGL